MTQIHYQLAAEDLPAFLETVPAWKRPLRHCVLPLLMALVSLPGAMWLAWLKHWTALGICLGTMGLLSVWLMRKAGHS